jgi:hypothetical protein
MNYSLGNMLSRGGALNPDGLALDLQFAADKTLTARRGPTPTFTRASTATFVGSNGLIQSAAINTPRFDHDPVTLACKGLLIEESRTNVLIQSDTLATQTITVTAAARTLSFYGTGTVVLSGAHIATVTGTGAYPTRTTLTFTPTAGSLILTVIGSVRQAQLETGSFPTSYIPTTTASVVRSADVCSITGSNFTGFYNQSEGTFFGDATPQTVNQLVVVVGANTSASTASHFIYKSNNLINATGKRWTAQTVSTGVQTAIATGADVAISASKLSYAYKLNDFAFVYAGSIVGTDSSGTIPTPTAMRIGCRDDGLQINGHIAAIRYYKKRLANAKLQSLTL